VAVATGSRGGGRSAFVEVPITAGGGFKQYLRYDNSEYVVDSEFLGGTRSSERLSGAKSVNDDRRWPSRIQYRWRAIELNGED